MGPAGAAAVAIFAAIVAAAGAALAAAAWAGARGASRSRAGSWARALAPVGLVVLALGVILPKGILRDVEFESSGRFVMLAVSLVGVGAAALALRRREPGAAWALACHVYFAALAGSLVGEWVFGVFRML